MNNRIFFDDEDDLPRMKTKTRKPRFNDMDCDLRKKKKMDKKKRPRFDKFDDASWNDPGRKKSRLEAKTSANGSKINESCNPSKVSGCSFIFIKKHILYT